MLEQLSMKKGPNKKIKTQQRKCNFNFSVSFAQQKIAFYISFVLCRKDCISIFFLVLFSLGMYKIKI